jgi:hypothetical protein
MGLDRLLYNFARKGIIPGLRSAVGSGSVIMDADGALKPGGVGKRYCVAGNYGLDGTYGHDGSSWERAFKTLEYATTINNANIAANSYGWAARNKMYISGDRFTEDLVAFPNKCDVIGVGSCDAYTKAGIRGNHAPVNTDNYGTRFINVQFEPAASSDLITLASTSSGPQFLDCNFIGVFGAYTAPSAIQTTACELVKILGCNFEGAFSGDIIDICAGQINGMRIIGNNIVGGANDGIIVSGVATVTGISDRGIIADNFIQVAAITLDTRAVSVFNVYGNRLISAAAVGAGSYVIDLTYACNNWLTGADVMVPIPTYVNADA